MDLGRIGWSDHAQLRSYMGAKAFPGNGSRTRSASEEMSGRKTLDEMTEQERKKFEDELDEELLAADSPLSEEANGGERMEAEEVIQEVRWLNKRSETVQKIRGQPVWKEEIEQERSVDWLDESVELMNSLRALANVNLLFWENTEAKIETEEERVFSYLGELRQQVTVRLTELEVKLQIVHDSWLKKGSSTEEVKKLREQLEQVERREDRQRKMFSEDSKRKDRLVRELAIKNESLQKRGHTNTDDQTENELEELRLKNEALTQELEVLKSEYQERRRLTLELQREDRETTAEATTWRLEAGMTRQEETSHERGQRPERSRRARGQDPESERREESRWNSRVGEAWVRNASMPPMSTYEGKGPFHEFVRRFLVRYEGSGMTDAQMTVLFEELLRGYPRSVFQSLPLYLKNGNNFEEMVDMMEERMQPDILMRKLGVVRELKKLERRKGQTVASFSLALEQKTEKLYGRMERREKEELQALFFIDGVQLGDGYLRLVQRLEETGGNQSKYEEVKKEAMRLELMDSLRRNEERREVSISRPQEIIKARVLNCTNCGGTGHSWRVCTSRGEDPSKRNTENRTGTGRPQGRPPAGRIGGSLEEKRHRMCRVDKEREEDIEAECPLIGPTWKATVRINGVTVTALLDSGGAASVIPVDMMEQLQIGKMESIATDYRLVDASGRTMNIEGVAKARVEMPGGPAGEVSFHIQDIKDGIVLLGTNAQKLWKNWFLEKEKGEGMATVVERVYVPPKGTAIIKVGGDKGKGEESVLWPSVDAIECGVWNSTEDGVHEVTVMNGSDTGMLLQRGQDVGRWEKVMWMEVRQKGTPTIEKVEEKRVRDILDCVDKNGKVEDEGVRCLLRENADVFAVCDEEMGQTTLIRHEIRTGDAPPIRQKQRPVPLGLQDQVKKLLTDMEGRGVIRKSKSPWASPLVLVKKKDGSIRMCVDYRRLNDVVVKDAHPLPNSDMIVQSVRGKRVFSTLDLISGYWQVPLKEEDKEKTAFGTMGGLYEFQVLPFGLTTSPAIFQRLMNTVLEGVLGDGVFCYIDDILIATKTVQEHVRVLGRVLRALRRAGLRLKPQKCVVAQQSVDFLGHVIEENGLKMEEEKVQKVREFPEPKNAKELRRVLGMAGYYRKFVKGYAAIVSPLCALTGQGKRWCWKEEHKEAFQKLKDGLCTAPILAQPDVAAAQSGARPFFVYTDASNTGIGAVLMQEDEEARMRPIAYASRQLAKAERNYHVSDLEAAAVLFGVRKFRYIILGTKTIIRTDHQPLTSLFKQKELSSRLQRWTNELRLYDITIEYVNGAVNAVADALSRAYEGKEEEVKEKNWEYTPLSEEMVVAQVMVNKKDMSIDEQIMKWRNEGEMELKVKGAVYRKEGDEVKVKLIGKKWKTWVSPERREKLLKDLHYGQLSGHWGMNKMTKMLNKRWWNSMRGDIEKVVRGCKSCLVFNNTTTMVPPLKPLRIMQRFDTVGVDVVEYGQSASGNRYVLSVVDAFTKFGAAYPLKDKSAASVATKLVRRWMMYEGRVPQRILSDQGKEFLNKITEEVYRLMGIEGIETKGYNPRENGLTERFNQTIERILQKRGGDPVEWDRQLPYAVYAYNTAPHRMTGESPFFLMYGTDPKEWTEEAGQDKTKYFEMDLGDYRKELIEGLKMAHQEAREKVEKEASKMKAYYDKENKVENMRYPEVGERVYVKAPGEKRGQRNPKLICEWEGPYRVIEKSQNSALVERCGKKKRSRYG